MREGEVEWVTRRQEQKPGRASHCARAFSAGRRAASSALSELTRTAYMAGTSAAESAIRHHRRRRVKERWKRRRLAGRGGGGGSTGRSEKMSGAGLEGGGGFAIAMLCTRGHKSRPQTDGKWDGRLYFSFLSIFCFCFCVPEWNERNSECHKNFGSLELNYILIILI